MHKQTQDAAHPSFALLVISLPEYALMQAWRIFCNPSDSAYARKNEPPDFHPVRDRKFGGTTLINAHICILLLIPLSPVLRCAPHAGLRGRFRTVPVKASHQRLSLCNVSYPYYSLLHHVQLCGGGIPLSHHSIFIHSSRMNAFCQPLL